MTEPLSPEDEASVRHWIAQHEFMTPTLGHGVAALEVLPRLLATLDAARQSAPEAALREAAQEVVDATDALDEYEVNHSEWETAGRAPFAGRLSLAIEDLRAALAATPTPEDPR